MKRRILQILPWLLTGIALWIAFRGIRWEALFDHLGSAHADWLLLAVALTCSSYVFRSRRWQILFPGWVLKFYDSFRVLILGFFMNNILPARAGEFVRAHLGAKVSGKKRTLVLATIANERLLDGLTLSMIFVLSSFGLRDQGLSHSFSYVALLFLVAGLAVIGVIVFRERLFGLTEKIARKLNHKASDYTHDRIHVFIDGLSPLCTWRKLLPLVLWSGVIWSVELFVYWAMGQTYEVDLTLAQCALFMVAVNFSSLIPAAPGGLGIIEAVGSAVLVSFGIPKEQALTLVITQHAIQYLVIGIPGALFLASTKGLLKDMKSAKND